jgi:hypothetical protein
MMLIYTFTDAIDNPVYGFLSDRTRTRWGRRRPWLVIGTPLLILCLIAFYNLPSFLMQARAELYFKEGQPEGFQLSQIQKGSLLSPQACETQDPLCPSPFKTQPGELISHTLLPYLLKFVQCPEYAPDLIPLHPKALHHPLQELPVVHPDLETLQDVGEVMFMGDRRRQVQLLLNADRMNAYGLTVDQVRTAVDRQNVEVPGGTFIAGPSEIALRTMGRITTVNDFNRIILAYRQGSVVTFGVAYLHRRVPCPSDVPHPQLAAPGQYCAIEHGAVALPRCIGLNTGWTYFCGEW